MSLSMSTNPNSNPTPITDIMDPRLDVFRPDPSVVETYVSRTLPGGLKDTLVLMSYWIKRQNLMLAGDTQSGKTLLVQVMSCLIAQREGLEKPLPIFMLSGSSGVTDYDLFGQPTVYADEDGNESVVWLDGLVDTAARVGGILYLDETTHFEDRVISSLHPLTDFRRMFINRAKAVKVDGHYQPEVVKAHENLWIVGTYNVGYRGTAPLAEAFSNRFKHLRWDYDSDVENLLIRYESVKTLATALRNARRMGNLTTPVGVSAFQTLEDDISRFGPVFALWAFTGMFSPREQEKVTSILEDLSIEAMLVDEVDTTEMFDNDKEA